MSEIYYCPAQTRAPRMYVDPEPGEWCETEVEERGQHCAQHEELDDDPWAG